MREPDASGKARTWRQLVLPLSSERTIGFLSLFCLVVILASFALLAVHARANQIEEAERQTAGTAFFLADHAARLLEASDLVVTGVVGEIRGIGWQEIEGSPVLWDRLKSLQKRFPYIEAIWLNDTTGRLRLTTLRWPTPVSNAADRDFFKVQLEPGRGLYVSLSTRGRVTDRTTFLLSRRLENPDGGFMGIAAITVDLEYFANFYDALDLPFDPVITLFRDGDLDPLVQHPLPPAGAPQLLHEPGLLRRSLREEPVAARLQEVSPADGRRYLAAYRRVSDLPLLVSVSVPEEAITRQWLQDLQIYGLLAGVALAALVVLTVLAFRRARIERSVARELERRVEERTSALTAANRELEILFQEVHHRVKNNLQVISSLLRLQSIRVVDPELRLAMQKSMDRVHAMSLVHELLYRSEELAALDFAAYLRILAERLTDAYGLASRVRIEVNADGVRFDLNTAIPVALIVNEVLSNALKHAFADQRGGRIQVALRQNESETEMLIRDDGVGPRRQDWMSAPGLGLQIVRSLAQQLQARADFSSDGGTCFRLAFRSSEAAPERALPERKTVTT